MRTSLSAILFAASIAVPAHADQAFVSDYRVTLLGITIADASFTSTISDDSFRIDGSLASRGMARLFDRIDGRVTVAGGLSATGTQPESYVLDYRSNDRPRSTDIRFSRGAVTSTRNVPEPPQRSAEWIHIDQAQLSSVVDPISSTLVRAGSLEQVCDRTLRIYDGEMRADLALSPAGLPEGGRVTCTARFQPVSGYRPSRSAIRYLRDNSRITMTFAPLADTGFYAPVDAAIGTQVGTVRIAAQSIRRQ